MFVQFLWNVENNYFELRILKKLIESLVGDFK